MIKKNYLTAIFLTALNAQALELEYAGFYNYLKEANHHQYNLVRPAFYLTSKAKNACQIQNAQIRTLQTHYPLVVDRGSGEFFVPYDKRLKDSRATLWFDASEHCKLNVAVIADAEGKHFSTQSLSEMAEQIDALMSDYAGTVSFLMPKWSAVVAHSDSGQQQLFTKESLKKQDKVTLTWPVTHFTLQMVKE